MSRSVYQKVCEENKKLLADIKNLTGGDAKKHADIYVKWKTHFDKEREFNSIMKQVAGEYLKRNPEFDITSPLFKKP